MEIKRIADEDWEKTNGTSLQGYIHATYSQLVEKLGEPDGESADGKARVEWELEIDGTVVATHGQSPKAYFRGFGDEGTDGGKSDGQTHTQKQGGNQKADK